MTALSGLSPKTGNMLSLNLKDQERGGNEFSYYQAFFKPTSAVVLKEFRRQAYAALERKGE
jgi:hypothetical protein